MNRCNTRTFASTRTRGAWLATLACLALLGGAASTAATAQTVAATGLARTFPANALRGTLNFQDRTTALLNGNAIQVAPGMRLFSPQNALVMTHTVQGKPLKVNYVTEASMGMLLTAWILTPAEAALPRKGSDTETNVRFEWDTKPAALR